MPKTHYLATFADGTTAELKGSTRSYSHAWRYTVAPVGEYGGHSKTGFARTAELADRAAWSEARFLSNPYAGKRGRRLTSDQRAAFEARVTVEVVPAVIIVP